MESTKPQLTWRSLFTITPIIFTLICSLCGFVIAFYYESRIGEMLVKSHSIEDYFRITLSARNIEAVVKSILLSLGVGVLVCFYHSIGSKIVEILKTKNMKDSGDSLILKALEIFNKQLALKISVLFFFSVTLILYVTLNDEMRVKFARIESGLTTILSVKTKDSGTINCLAHIQEINGFTYFYSHKKSEIISLATSQILNIKKDPLFKSIPIEVTPYDTLSSGIKVWSDSLSSEDFEMNGSYFDSLSTSFLNITKKVDEIEPEQEINNTEALTAKYEEAFKALEESVSTLLKSKRHGELSKDSTKSIAKSLSPKLSTVVMSVCKLQDETDKNLQ